MHEDRLIDAVIEDVLARMKAAGATRVRRLVLELSPDSHMDEMSVQLHLESHLEETPIAGAELVFRHVGGRLWCPACKAEFPRVPDVFTCPTCGGGGRPTGLVSGLRVLEVELG
jgi:Zn finger protein HypA/HybF involved in hydrogenase expression